MSLTYKDVTSSGVNLLNVFRALDEVRDGLRELELVCLWPGSDPWPPDYHVRLSWSPLPGGVLQFWAVPRTASRPLEFRVRAACPLALLASAWEVAAGGERKTAFVKIKDFEFFND